MIFEIKKKLAAAIAQLSKKTGQESPMGLEQPDTQQTAVSTEQFANKTVQEWIVDSPLPDTQQCAVKLVMYPYDEGLTDFKDYFEKFIQLPDVETVDTLIIGCWGEPYDADSSVVVKLLVQHKDKLPALTALFIGDLAQEEAEISWIQQSDISPIYSAFPRLTYLKVRGAENLSLGNINHECLQKLVIETGGMDKSILKQIHLANLPALTHLELWLGDEEYGCDIGTDEINTFMAGLSQQFTKLTYLGLRNYYLTDDLAQVMSKADLPAALETLDLSLGTLTDKGAEHLFSSEKFATLKTLDLHHHYLSNDKMKQLAASQLVQTIILDDQNEPDDYGDEIYYSIFISE